MAEEKNIVIGIGGASGSMYAYHLLERLKEIPSVTASVVLSKNAIINWELEIGKWSENDYPEFTFYKSNDFFAPFASGSAKNDGMIIIPCSMGLLGRIASGISTDLITRAADVQLKERRKLILVTRDMPLSLIHINNMKTVTEAGAIVCPPIPSFYSQPKDIREVVLTVVDRVLDLAGINISTYRWGDESTKSS